MEKFRKVLEVLNKYHFWILCGFIVLVCFGTWFLATSDQEDRYAKKTKDIDSKMSQVKQIAQNNEHPSAKYIQEIKDITNGSLTKQVETASNRLYDEQRMSNPLPIVFPVKEEQERFRAAFEKIWGRMEDIEKLPTDALLEFYRNRYRNHITEHFPELFKLIERRTEVIPSNDSGDPTHPQAATDVGLATDASDPNKKFTGIVTWDDAGQKMLIFSNRFAGSTPSTLEIMMAQEELWVYESLLKVIRNTNDIGSDLTHRDPTKYKKPESHKLARIKQILAMDIGRDALQSWGVCDKALINLGTDPGTPPPTTSGAGIYSLLAGRYVDNKGKPLDDPTQQPFNEFRMMPVNLKVIIEQKEIPRFLAECANSPMRIDVRGVRILAEEVAALDTGTDSNAATTTDVKTAPTPAAVQAPATDRPFHGQRMGGFRGRPKSIILGAGTTKEAAAYLDDSADPVYPPVPVEVQGIIYIYNPPPAQPAAQTPGGTNPSVAPGAPNTATPASATAVPASGAPAAPAGAPTVTPSTATPSTVAPAPSTMPAAPAAPAGLPTTKP